MGIGMGTQGREGESESWPARNDEEIVYFCCLLTREIIFVIVGYRSAPCLPVFALQEGTKVCGQTGGCLSVRLSVRLSVAWSAELGTCLSVCLAGWLSFSLGLCSPDLYDA